MKILLISPPSETPFSKNDPFYPLGLLYLASVLEKEGHNVFVKDCYRNSWEEIKQELVELIKDYSPDIFGLSCNTLNRTSCFKLSKIVKEINPKIKIIIGGVHATSLYEQILLNYPIDVVVLGEGEISTPKLIRALGKKRSIKKIRGIAFKDKNQIKFTGFEKPIHNLDEIPFPKHEFCEDIIKKTKTATMITSRGCPFKCVFCSTSAYWGRRWRSRSVKNVVDEIEYLLKEFPYLERIIIPDDTFILDNQRVIEICNEILKRKIKIKWECSGRVDMVSKEMLVKLKEAGCDKITYGVESGSEKILESINKKITKEQIKRAIRLTNEVGLDYGTYLMVGNPGETWETLKQTVDFLKELKNLKVQSVGKLEIYPNTEIYELAKKQGIIDDSYWLTEKTVPHYTFEHSEDELTEMAYYIVAKNQLNIGMINFAVFCFKFFLQKPKKAVRYGFIKLGVLR